MDHLGEQHKDFVKAICNLKKEEALQLHDLFNYLVSEKVSPDTTRGYSAKMKKEDQQQKI